MRFLVDAQLPPVLAAWLEQAGHQAQHVEQCGLREAADGTIWAHALRTEAVILTKDEDFAQRAARSEDAPVIVWLRVGNATNRALHAWFMARLPGIVRFLESGTKLVEVI